jgi:hypothetical protein
MNSLGGATRVAPPAANGSSDHLEKVDMDQPSPQRGGESGVSWPRVLWNTLVLKLRRGRVRNPDDQLLSLRGRALLAGGIVLLVGLGGLGAYLVDPTGLDRLGKRSGSSAETTDSSTETRSDGGAPPSQRRPSTPREASPVSGHAAAGTELAARSDISVSAAAANVLRSGAVDGRVLLVLAGLASNHSLAVIDVAPDDGITTSSEIEIGVNDVDAVLAWLDTQPKLRPDQVEIRRDGSRSFLRLIYQSPEPPGLFPS